MGLFGAAVGNQQQLTQQWASDLALRGNNTLGYTAPGIGAALGGASNIRSDKVTQIQRELNILDNKIIDALCHVYDRNLVLALLDLRYQVDVTQKVNLAPKPKPKPPEPVTKYQKAVKCKQLGGPDPFGRNVAIPKTNTVHLIEYKSDDKPDYRSAIKSLCGAKTSTYDWITNPYRWRFLTDDDIGAGYFVQPNCKECEKKKERAVKLRRFCEDQTEVYLNEIENEWDGISGDK